MIRGFFITGNGYGDILEKEVEIQELPEGAKSDDLTFLFRVEDGGSQFVLWLIIDQSTAFSAAFDGSLELVSDQTLARCAAALLAVAGDQP
jgi:hypothetical protein